MAYRFTDSDDVNFRVQLLLGGVGFGLGDVGEILQAVTTIGDGDDPCGPPPSPTWHDVSKASRRTRHRPATPEVQGTPIYERRSTTPRNKTRN